MPTAADIIEDARECIGTRWVHQGRVPGQRLDCVGVVLHILHKRKITDFEPPPYQKTAKWDEFLPHFRANLIEVPRKEMRPADVLCFRQEHYPCHCGILTGDRFVHSYVPRHKVVEELFTPWWRNVLVAVFRIPGVEG